MQGEVTWPGIPGAETAFLQKFVDLKEPDRTVRDLLAGEVEEANPGLPFPSIFTGLYPASHGVNQTIFLLLRARSHREINVPYQGLDPNIPSIASKCRDKNYITQAFSGGGTVSGDIGFAHSHSGYVEIDFAKESTEPVKKWIDEHKDFPFYPNSDTRARPWLGQ